MITARGLTKAFGKTFAVDALSFDVEPGVVTGFLGPNGSGKSTTMRMIVGLDNPTSGSTTVNGSPYSELRWPLREVGSLLDAKAFHPGRSAYNQLLVLARTNDIPVRRIDEVLDTVGLTDVARSRAGKYSLGMGQRLGIASALLGDPGVLLFDEPINGLDPEGIRWVRHLLRRLASEGRTVFVSSHLINEMALTADRLVVIGRGTLIAETSVDDFTRRAALQGVRVVAPDPETFQSTVRVFGGTPRLEPDGSVVVTGMTAAQIGDLAAHRSLTLHELTPIHASLEDAFMESTRDSIQFRSRTEEAPRAVEDRTLTRAGSRRKDGF